MNEVSIIINGVRYDVEKAELIGCSSCDLKQACEVMRNGFCSVFNLGFKSYFKKSTKSFVP